MRKLLLTFLIVIFFSPKSFSQNISVDQVTGKPDVNLPVWTVHAGDLSAGISLSYYGSPKVNDGESTAGMGWNLVAGGGVYRQLRDLPDDFITGTRKGWLHGGVANAVTAFSPSSPNYSICSTAEIADGSSLNSLASNDLEPDVFSFSAPGLSGQFVFDGHKAVQTVPYQDLKIVVTRENIDSLINEIVITNNQGVQYTFMAGDLTTRYSLASSLGTPSMLARNYFLYLTPVNYYSSWYLTSISSPAGGSISFTYTTDPTTSLAAQYKQIVNESSGNIDTLYSDNFSTTTKSLSAITGSNEQATFTWVGHVLSSIVVKDRTYQTLSKSFNLQYHYVNGSVKVTGKKRVKRAFLSGLTETVDCAAFPGYSFSYYGVNFTADTTSIPFNSGRGQDLFGYYDSTAQTLKPDLYVQDSDAGTDGERYRIAPASGYSLMVSASLNRVVDPSKVYFGALKTIRIPSGGTSTFTYEAAEYYDALTNTSIKGGGPRVKSIRVSANDPQDVVTTYKYVTSSNVSSGQWTYRPMFVVFNAAASAVRVPYNLAPEESILYSRVEVSTTGKGKTVYEFQNHGMYGITSSGDFTATLTHMARPTQSPCESLGSLKSGYYTFPYAPNTNYDFERGQPTRITDYTRAGKIVKRTLYTYQRTSTTAASVGGIRMELVGDILQFGKYAILANVTNLSATQTSRVYDQTDTSYVETVSSYTYSANQMLSRTTTTNSDGAVYYKNYLYAKDYATTGTDTQSTMVNSLVAANRHGTLIENYSQNGTDAIDAHLTLFNNFDGRVLPSQLLTLGNPAGFAHSTVSGASFVYSSSNYYPTAYFDGYDGLGHPTILRDQSRIIKSSIVGYNGSVVALDIANARYDQVAFADFEPAAYMTTAVSSSGTTAADSWSGKYSTAMTSATNISQNSLTRGLGKNYRFSCWAKAGASTTLTISINNTSFATATYPVGGASAGTWQFVEATVDMSAITPGSSFNFKLTSNGNINIDNLVYYPASATVSSHAYEPLNGKTADLDSRGVSGFQEYDALGRVHFIRNMDKDIVQIKDYHYASSNGILPVSSFSGNASPNMGVSTTYTADPTCTGGVTYQWNIYDATGTIVQSSTSTSITYAFTQFETYRVSLTASASFGSSSTQMVVNPLPSLGATMNISGPTPIGAQYCDTSPEWTLSLTPTGCASNLTYRWYYIVGSPGAEIELGTTSSVVFSSVSDVSTTVYCTLRSTCTNPTTGVSETITTSASRSFQCRDREGGQ